MAATITPAAPPSALQGIYDAADQLRAEVLAGEMNANGHLLRAYGQAWTRIQADLDKEIGKMVAAGLNSTETYQRLKALERDVEREINDVAQYAGSFAKGEQAKAIEAAASHAEILALASNEAGGGAAINFNRVPKEAMADLVGYTQNGSPLQALFAQLGNEASKAARSALITGLAMGESPLAVSKRMSAVMNGNAARAMTIARTETMRAYRESTRRHYEVNSDLVSGWLWHASLERRTCACCWAMHGTFHKVSERLDGHPNCRCSMVPVTKTWAELGFEDDGQGPFTVKRGAKVFEQLPEDDKLAILGPKRFALLQNKDITLSDLVQRTDNGAWGSMRREATADEALANHGTAKPWFTVTPPGVLTPAQKKAATKLAADAAKKAAGGDLAGAHADLAGTLDTIAGHKAAEEAHAAAVHAAEQAAAHQAAEHAAAQAAAQHAAEQHAAAQAAQAQAAAAHAHLPFDPTKLRRDDAESAALAGAHTKHVLIDEHGHPWLFKPQERFRAELDVATSRIATRAGLDAPDTHVIEWNGHVGSIQQMYGLKRDNSVRMAFPNVGPSGAGFKPELLDLKDTAQLQKHAVFDWLIGNHDAHAEQFVKVKSTGGKIFGIDKGQAFKFFGKDKLDYTYKPNASFGVNSVYNLMHEAYASGKNLTHFERVTAGGTGQVSTFVKALETIPDAEYKALLRPYAEGAKRAGFLAKGTAFENDVDAFLYHAVSRKNHLAHDFEQYHTILANDRAMHVPAAPPPSAITPPPLAEPKTAASLKGWKESLKQTTRAGTAWAKRVWPSREAMGFTAYTPEDAAVTSYTGGGYTPINGFLRRLTGHRAPQTDESRRRVSEHIAALDKVMEQAPRVDKEVIVSRGTGLDTWPGVSNPLDLKGRFIVEQGFLSTSVGETPAFDREAMLRLRVPKGQKAVYVSNGWSSVGNHEHELLLDRGITYFVHEVRQERVGYSLKWVIEAEIIP